MYVRCDESSLYSRINYVQPWRGTSGVSGANKHAQGLAHVLHYANAPVLTILRNRRYDLARKDWGSGSNAHK